MKLNHDKLHTDVLIKLKRLNTSQRLGCKKIGISRATLNRLSKGKPIFLETYLTLVDWLESNLEYYIERDERPAYIQNRISRFNKPN